MAMGRSEQEAHCSVRFSLSHYTTEDEVDDTVSALAQVLEEKERVRLIPCK
jgi:cysteine desulfurase